jgi:polysaccharide export outer membrane protein
MNSRWSTRIASVRRILLLAAGLAAGALTPGCLRVNVMPQPKHEVVASMSEPKPVDRLVVPREKDPTKQYRIGPRDVLRIDVRKDPAISQVGGYMVTEEGNILLPYIGAVQVADLTSSEAEKKLNTLLAEYIREPDAKVGLLDYRSKYIYVVGQVARPGRQIMRADMMTLQEAVFNAGLATPDAALTRAKVITPADEYPIVLQIDLTNIIFKGRMAENIMLQPGDIVYVPAKQSANLTAAIIDLIRPATVVAGTARDITDAYNNIRYGNNNNNNNNNTGPSTSGTSGTSGTTTTGGGFTGF